MQALPSAFFHQVSSASRIFVPRAWMAKSTMRGGAAERRGARAGFEIVGARWCRRRACRDACARRCRRAARSMPVASMIVCRRVCRDAGAHFLDALAFDQQVGRE